MSEFFYFFQAAIVDNSRENRYIYSIADIL